MVLMSLGEKEGKDTKRKHAQIHFSTRKMPKNTGFQERIYIQINFFFGLPKSQFRKATSATYWTSDNNIQDAQPLNSRVKLLREA